jgi:hypothetical protein
MAAPAVAEADRRGQRHAAQAVELGENGRLDQAQRGGLEVDRAEHELGLAPGRPHDQLEPFRRPGAPLAQGAILRRDRDAQGHGQGHEQGDGDRTCEIAAQVGPHQGPGVHGIARVRRRASLPG